MAEPSPGPTVPSSPEQALGNWVQQGTVPSADWTSTPVWTGITRPDRTDSDQTGSWTVAGGREYVPAGQLLDKWYDSDWALDKKRLKDTFILMGLVNPLRATDADYYSVWAQYVKQASDNARVNAFTGKDMSVFDMIHADFKTREENDPAMRDLMRTGKRTTTRTSTNIQKSSKLDAKAIASAAAKALLGREANDIESASLLTALNEYESANPEVTTSTQEEDMYGTVLGGSSTTTGGVTAAGREQLAKEQAQANPEYGAYQAATYFNDALMDLIFGKGY